MAASYNRSRKDSKMAVIVEMYAIEKSEHEPMFYSGSRTPSTKYDTRKGTMIEYVPVIWAEAIFDATRFTTKQEAIDVAKLVSREIGYPVRVITVKVRRNRAV